MSFKDHICKLYENQSHIASGLLSKAQMTENLFMILNATVIGIITGLAAVGLRELIFLVGKVAFAGSGNFLQRAIAAPWYVKLLAPAIGGLLMGPFIHFLAPEAKGHGIPEVMKAILLKGGSIPPIVAVAKAIASALTIGTGGSVGREGPIVQMGGSIGSTIGQFFRAPSKRLKTLAACGAAAGIAASFNAPIAGALFAVEIIIMDFSIAQFSPIVIASVWATVISRAIEGDFAEYRFVSSAITSVIDLNAYVLLAFLCGLVAFLFIKVLYSLEKFWENKIHIISYLKPALGGLAVGLIGIFVPAIYGNGYDSVSLAISNQIVWQIALALVFIKILATSVTLASGGSGGVFAPSIFIGAMLGTAFGGIVNILFPNYSAPAVSFTLAAMGGMIAGTMHAPITAIFMVFEMTKNESLILPLMITAIISTIIAKKLSSESIYTLRLLLQNISFKDRAEIHIMKTISVADIYKDDFAAIPESANFNEVVSQIVSKKVPYLCVHSLNGEFLGFISINNIKDLLLDKDNLKYVLIAGDIADKAVERVTIHQNALAVMEKMSKTEYNALPVVDEIDHSEQIGIIWRKDIDDAYQKELERIELTSNIASKITNINTCQDVHFIEGYIISEIQAPLSFVGKSILELKIRSNYGVDVLSVKNSSEKGIEVKVIPQPDYVIRNGDYLIVAGAGENVAKLKYVN